MPRSAWDLGNAFVAGYSGKVGHAHDIDTIITAMVIVQQHQVQPTVSTPVTIESPSAGRPVPNDDPTPSKPGRKVRWLFISGDGQFERLKREAAKRNLKSVAFAPYQPRERLAESISVFMATAAH